MNGAEPIKGQRLYTLADATDPQSQAIARRASECAKNQRPFDAHGRRWLVTLIDVVDDNLIIEGTPLDGLPIAFATDGDGSDLEPGKTG